MDLVEPTDVTAPKRKPEDTAEGCRLLASDDRARAEESASAHMRFRLACSAEAWSARAELLERMEANRVRMNDECGVPGAREGMNDNG